MFVPGSGSDPTAARRRYSQDVGKGTTRPAGSTRTRVVSQGTAEAGATRNYILGDCLGKGASGSVYRALNWATGETVAIKRISLANIPRSDLSSIMSEIELLKGLRHPNIVKYKGFEKTQDFLFIVLEYCENGSLQSICKRFGRFPEGLVSVYINQVLEGLQFLHTQGVVHRDIKGANILTNKDGSVKLADFGVATKSGVISGNVVAGSPYWMAPEVIDQCGATSASDIWSVGCVVIELLEGRPPYHHLEPMPALFRIVQDDCPPLPGGASPMVLDFLKHCFEKDPTLRISAETLLEHPWMCSARRQLKHMNSTGSIGKDVHDQAVRTVRNHNRPSGRNGRPRPPPLRLDQAQPAQSDLLSPGLSTSRSLRRVAGSISPGPSAPSSPLRRSPLRLEQRAGSMGRDAESAALKATSVDVVLEEPKGTARSESCAAAPLEVHHGSRRRSINVVRKVPLRRCTRHSTDESHAALTKVQPTDAHFSLESASLSASGDDEGQARESYRHGSPPTAPDTTMTVSKMRSPPPVADAVGQRSLHGSPRCCDSLPRTQLTSLGHSHALDGRQEAADSEIPGCSPNPPLIIFRSPFAVVGTDLAPDSPIRASPEYVRSKDLSKVRESVSLLKQRDASGRKVLQASDRIYEADGRPTKASGRVQHTDATQDKRIIRRANSAMLAEGVPRNLPATARTPVTIPTFTESPPSRQSRYASGVKRSASILSRTFSRSSSPSRSTPRADSATRPGTDIAGDESIASFDRTSELGSSASREVIIRVLKGWR